MNSGTKKTLVAEAPDGTRVTVRTSGNYDLAGLARLQGKWEMVSKGSSHDSVLRGGRAASCGASVLVVLLREQVPWVIDAYMNIIGPRDQISARIEKIFSPATGWIPARSIDCAVWPGRSAIRKISHLDWTGISVKINGREADFQREELNQ